MHLNFNIRNTAFTVLAFLLLSIDTSHCYAQSEPEAPFRLEIRKEKGLIRPRHVLWSGDILKYRKAGKEKIRLPGVLEGYQEKNRLIKISGVWIPVSELASIQYRQRGFGWFRILPLAVGLMALGLGYQMIKLINEAEHFGEKLLLVLTFLPFLIFFGIYSLAALFTSLFSNSILKNISLGRRPYRLSKIPPSNRQIRKLYK